MCVQYATGLQGMQICAGPAGAVQSPSLMSQPLSHTLSAHCDVAILIQPEHNPDCGAAPSLFNSDLKCWPGLTPTLKNSQFMKGEGQKECHELEQRLFQTIKLQTAPHELWCGRE